MGTGGRVHSGEVAHASTDLINVTEAHFDVGDIFLLWSLHRRHASGFGSTEGVEAVGH